MMLPALPRAVALLSAVAVQMGLEENQRSCTGKSMPGRVPRWLQALQARVPRAGVCSNAGDMAVHAACTGGDQACKLQTEMMP